MLQKNLSWIDVADDQVFFSKYVAMNSPAGLCVDCRTFNQIVKAKKDEQSQKISSIDALSPAIVEAKDGAENELQNCLEKVYAEKVPQPMHPKSAPKIHHNPVALPSRNLGEFLSKYPDLEEFLTGSDTEDSEENSF